MKGQEPLIPDQPLRLVDLVIGAFRYMRRNPAATLGVGALLSTATATVNGIVLDGILLGSDPNSPVNRVLGGATPTEADAAAFAQQITDAAPYLAFAAIVSIIVGFAAVGVMTLGMLQAVRGERVDASAVWRNVPWARLVRVNLAVVGLMLLGAVAPTIIAFFVGGSLGLIALTSALAAAVLIALITVLAVPVTVIEGLGATASLGRSAQLMRGGLFRTVGVLFASTILWEGIGSAIGGPIGSLFGGLAGGSDSAAGSALASLSANIVSGAIALPAVAGTTVLVYIDRVRRIAQ